MFDPVWNCVYKNPDTVFREFVLVPLFPLGSIRTMFLIMHQNSSGEEVCSQALGSRSLKLQACGACCSISLQRAYCLLSTQAQKALWHSSYLWFFCVLSLINSLPDRILAGSYNGMYFKGSHFMTRKVSSVFSGGCWYHASISYDSVF